MVAHPSSQSCFPFAALAAPDEQAAIARTEVTIIVAALDGGSTFLAVDGLAGHRGNSGRHVARKCNAPVTAALGHGSALPGGFPSPGGSGSGGFASAVPLGSTGAALSAFALVLAFALALALALITRMSRIVQTRSNALLRSFSLMALRLSGCGVSLTEGVPGAHLTIGRKPRITLGIPGSGLSWTETMEHGRRAPHGAQSASQAAPTPRPGWQVALIVIALLGVLMIILGGGGHP
jgi:Protein of unknown function (DUF4236)